jgi:DNA helicase-2/ATP-dependent DNA helicase PcrA
MKDNEPVYMQQLNAKQREAVEHTGSPLLILAGAGSGKTRVITTKIAYLVDRHGVDPASILAVTFTNKAAREMHERVASMVPKASGTLIRTFHSFGAWLLRRNGAAIGMNRSFHIYDDDDMVTLLHTIYEERKRRELRRYAKLISLAKDYALSPEDDLLSITPDPEFPPIYKAYQEKLEALGNADFGDLILRCIELLDSNPEIRSRLHQRFRIILVDEYQDSNVAQFELLKRLKGEETYLCVVGDDDQSIYRFRGAEVRNIIEFPDIFPDTTIVRLEENYRSTQNILSVATSVVQNNSGRLGKTLWTQKRGGKKAVVRFFENHRQEVEYCAGLLQEGKLGGTAILYRTNAQSREFEIFFSKNNIPYRLVGSISFYNREEVKDVLAFLALLVNPQDELAFRRIVNKPARGIGKSTCNKILERVSETGGNILEAASRSLDTLSSKASRSVRTFLEIAATLKGALSADSLGQFVERVITESGLYEYHMDQDRVGNTRKTRNLEELVTAASDYPGGEEGLLQFLESIELDRSRIADTMADEGEKVTLITMHNTKGLEFDRVIITGLEEGIFPGFQNEMDEDLEEERRIFYVSLTRAREELYLTSCRSRKVWGKTMRFQPSRFLEEIPKELLEVDLGDTAYSGSEESGGDTGFKVGSVVYHDDYGTGIICKKWYNGSRTSVLVRFETGKTHIFIPEYSALEKIEE